MRMAAVARTYVVRVTLVAAPLPFAGLLNTTVASVRLLRPKVRRQNKGVGSTAGP